MRLQNLSIIEEEVHNTFLICKNELGKYENKPEKEIPDHLVPFKKIIDKMKKINDLMYEMKLGG